MVRRWLLIAILAGAAGCASKGAGPELVTGMPLQTALEILRKNDIKAEGDDGAYVPAPGFVEAKSYYVRPAGSQDALYFVAARKADERSLTLTSIFWWKDWVHDTKQPKGLRKNREVVLQKIPLKSLK